MSDPRPWLDPIGLAYARNFDEVETARSQFEQQRARVLDRLRDVTRAAWASAATALDGPPAREDGWDTWSITGAWTAVRQSVGRKQHGQSGVSVGLGHDACFAAAGGACFGFGAYVYFAMSPGRFEKTCAALVTAAQPHDAAVDYDPDGRIAYVRCAWIRPADDGFDLATFEARVQPLPEQFTTLDRALAAAYEQSKRA